MQAFPLAWFPASCRSIKIPSGGGTAYEVQGEDDDTDPMKTITGVVVFTHRLSGYWPNAYGSSNNPEDKLPTCASWKSFITARAVGFFCCAIFYSSVSFSPGSASSSLSGPLIGSASWKPPLSAHQEGDKEKEMKPEYEQLELDTRPALLKAITTAERIPRSFLVSSAMLLTAPLIFPICSAAMPYASCRRFR